MKEAQASVLEPYLGASEFQNHGERVVRGQRLSQAAIDVFLGWQRSVGLDGKEHDFYIRQLWDWKASIDLAPMSYAGLNAYTRACGWSLARAHARWVTDSQSPRISAPGHRSIGRSFASPPRMPIRTSLTTSDSPTLSALARWLPCATFELRGVSYWMK